MMTGPLLPAMLVLLAVWLLIGPQRRTAPLGAASGSARRPGRFLLLGAIAAGSAAALLWGSAGVIWSVAAAIPASTVWKVARDHLGRRRERQRSRAVTEAARALAGRLSIGEVPTLALSKVAAELPILAPAQRAQEVGADVPAALLAASAAPGQRSLAGLARAWRMAELTGAPLAGATAAVAEAMRRRTRLEATLDSELAGPRASGRLMGLLPLAGLAMAHMVGAEPTAFLLGTSAGRICGLGAVSLSCAGVLWSEALADRVHREVLP